MLYFKHNHTLQTRIWFGIFTNINENLIIFCRLCLANTCTFSPVLFLFSKYNSDYLICKVLLYRWAVERIYDILLTKMQAYIEFTSQEHYWSNSGTKTIVSLELDHLSPYKFPLYILNDSRLDDIMPKIYTPLCK